MDVIMYIGYLDYWIICLKKMCSSWRLSGTVIQSDPKKARCFENTHAPPKTRNCPVVRQGLFTYRPTKAEVIQLELERCCDWRLYHIIRTRPSWRHLTLRQFYPLKNKLKGHRLSSLKELRSVTLCTHCITQQHDNKWYMDDFRQ